MSGQFNAAIDTFDGRLKEASPAIGSANPADAPVEDYTGRLRDTQPDIGAYEIPNLTSKIFMPMVMDELPVKKIVVAVVKPH